MDRNQINNALREFAFSGRATTSDIPYLYGLRDAQSGQGAFEGGPGGGIPNSGGGEIPSQGGGNSGAVDAGLPGFSPGGSDLAGGNFQAFQSRLAPGDRFDNGDGGRGDDGPADTGFSATGPLDDLDKDILDAIGFAAPGFGAVTGLTRAADYFGIPGVNTPASFGLPGTEQFARSIADYRAQQQISRDRHQRANDREAFGEASSPLGDHGLSDFGGVGSNSGDAGFGRDVNANESDFGRGLDSGFAPAGDYDEGPSLGEFGFGDANENDFGGRDGGNGGSSGGSGEGGSAGHGDSPGSDSGTYHTGGYIDDGDSTPGEEVQPTTLEGEYVMSQEAAQMFGELLPVMNAFARERFGAGGEGQNHNALAQRLQGY